jgi:hypothetical protein
MNLVGVVGGARQSDDAGISGVVFVEDDTPGLMYSAWTFMACASPETASGLDGLSLATLFGGIKRKPINILLVTAPGLCGHQFPSSISVITIHIHHILFGVLLSFFTALKQPFKTRMEWIVHGLEFPYSSPCLKYPCFSVVKCFSS